MILIHQTSKSLFRINLYKVFSKRISLNNLFLNNGIRLLSTEETAIEKITFSSNRFKRKPRYTIASWVLLIFPVSSFCLGTWQVFRNLEKQNINEEFYKIIKQPPVEFPQNLDELKSMEFRQVRVRGKFDHSKEIYMGPRSKIDDLTFTLPSSLLSRHKGGYLVITPFTLSDRNLTILVNRGWVPKHKKLPQNRQEGQITEEVEFVGLVRFQENRKPLGMRNDPQRGVWIYRDVEKMAEVTGAAPIFIDANEASSIPGGPLGGQTIIELRNEHLSYIFTWYAFSALSGYLWYLRHAKKFHIIV